MGGSGELTGRVAELERALAEANATIAALRAQVDPGPDPEFVVDPTGLVRAVNARASAWCAAAGLDTPRHIADLFTEADAEWVARFAEGGWHGVVDHRFTTLAGQVVSLNASLVAAGAAQVWRVTARDLTASQAVDAVHDERRTARALGALSGAIARELTDPISVVQGRMELLVALGEVPLDARDRHLRVALQHVRRIADTLHNLRLVAGVGAARADAVPVAEALSAAASLLVERARSARLLVDGVAGELLISGEEGMFVRLFSNLAGHLHDTCPHAGDVVARARRRGECVVVTLQCGTTADEVRRASAAPGDPLAESVALAVAETIVRGLGGQMERRRGANGASVSLHLPRAAARRGRRSDLSERVLFVGSPILGQQLARMLGPDGYQFSLCARAKRPVPCSNPPSSTC